MDSTSSGAYIKKQPVCQFRNSRPPAAGENFARQDRKCGDAPGRVLHRASQVSAYRKWGEEEHGSGVPDDQNRDGCNRQAREI